MSYYINIARLWDTNSLTYKSILFLQTYIATLPKSVEGTDTTMTKYA